MRNEGPSNWMKKLWSKRSKITNSFIAKNLVRKKSKRSRKHQDEVRVISSARSCTSKASNVARALRKCAYRSAIPNTKMLSKIDLV